MFSFHQVVIAMLFNPRLVFCVKREIVNELIEIIEKKGKLIRFFFGGGVSVTKKTF